MKMTLQRRTRLYVRLVALGLILAIQSLLLAQNAVPEEDLFEMDIEELLEVEISVASKKPESLIEAPGVVVVVPREEIEVYGDKNLHQLMQRQPSVYMPSSVFWTDNLAVFRGDLATHAETHTLILLNGRPIRDSSLAFDSPVYLTFPLASLESVELIRGPGSVLYGTNAFTGVINLKTRVPDQNKITVSSMAGSHGYYETDVTAGGRAGKIGYITAVRVAGQQGYPYRMTDALGVYGEDNRHDRSVSGTVHLGYRGLTFDIFASDMDLFHIGVMPYWFIPDHEIRNKRLFANAGYRFPIHDRMDLEFNLTYNLQENSLSSPAITRIGNNTSDFLGEVTLYARPLDNLNAVVGYLQEYRTTYKPDDDYFQSIPTYHYSPKGVYAQGDYKIGKNIKLIAGTQWNESAQGYSDFVSRYGLIITPFENWGLKLLRGEAFRGPIAMETDLYDPPFLEGNKNLKPETITTYDAQLFYHDKKTYAAVTYFYSRLDQQIVYTDTPPWSYLNGGGQRFKGIEFEAKRFLTPNWHVLGSFMHQENKLDSTTEDPRPVPANMIKFGTGYTWNSGTASIFYSFFSKPPRSSCPVVNNPEPEELNLVSVNLQLDPSKWLNIPKGRAALTLKVENLFNEKVYVPPYHDSPNSVPYGPGITFYGGLTVNF